MSAAKTILDFLAPVVSRTLAVIETLKKGGTPSQSAPETYAELDRGIKAAKSRALEAGKLEKNVDLAVFALVAWIDESFALHPQWSRGATPLQVSIFGIYSAGNDFFRKLNDVGEDQDEVRELYFLALSLGFRGEKDVGGEAVGTNQLKRQNAQLLKRRPLALGGLAEERVTPQPYQAPFPPAFVAPRSYGKWILLALGVLLLLALLGAAAWYFLRGPDLERIRAEMGRVQGGFECHTIALSLSDDARIAVSGEVQSPADRDRLLQDLAAIEEVAGVDGAPGVEPYPFCMVKQILRTGTAGAGQGLEIAPADGHARTYDKGEDLIVTVTAPSDSARWLYVDFVSGNGTIVHMLPTPLRPENQVRAEQHVRLGAPEADAGSRDRVYKIQVDSAVDARAMLVVIATTAPLFDALRPELEDGDDGRDYLRAVQDALLKQMSGAAKPVGTAVELTLRDGG